MTRLRNGKRRKVRIERLNGTALTRAAADNKIFTPSFVQYLATNPEPVYEPWVVERIAQVLLAQAQDRSQHFHASALGKCMRLQLFSRLAGPKPATETNVVQTNLFRDGHWRHLRLQADSLQAGIIDDIEVRFEAPQYELIGHMDGLAATTGVEFKGAREGTYRMVGFTGVIDDHATQARCYLLLSELAGRPMDAIAVVYEDKTTADWREFIIPRDEPALAKLRTRLEELVERWHDQRMPARLPSYPDAAPCSSCRFKADCGRIPTGGWIDDLMAPVPKRIRLARR